MRCSCRVCGTYMIQTERGLSSGCKCPDCGAQCHDCMGSIQGPMDIAKLRSRFEELEKDKELSDYDKE